MNAKRESFTERFKRAIDEIASRRYLGNESAEDFLNRHKVGEFTAIENPYFRTAAEFDDERRSEN